MNDIRARFSLDTKNWDAGCKGVKKDLRDLAGATRDIGSMVGGQAGGALGGVISNLQGLFAGPAGWVGLAAGAVAGILEYFKQLQKAWDDYYTEIDKIKDKTNISTVALDEMGRAFIRTGDSAETAAKKIAAVVDVWGKFIDKANKPGTVESNIAKQLGFDPETLNKLKSGLVDTNKELQTMIKGTTYEEKLAMGLSRNDIKTLETSATRQPSTSDADQKEAMRIALDTAKNAKIADENITDADFKRIYKETLTAELNGRSKLENEEAYTIRRAAEEKKNNEELTKNEDEYLTKYYDEEKKKSEDKAKEESAKIEAQGKKVEAERDKQSNFAKQEGKTVTSDKIKGFNDLLKERKSSALHGYAGVAVGVNAGGIDPFSEMTNLLGQIAKNTTKHFRNDNPDYWNY